MKTALAIAIIVMSTSLGELLIARGLRGVGEFSGLKLRDLISYGNKLLLNLTFLGGFIFMTVSFFAFMIALSWADLSLVVPATSISYVVTTLGAKFYLRENVNSLRWAGTLFVCLGVVLISFP
jgi:drug/metabolite transporter (DMT)-like permease